MSDAEQKEDHTALGCDSLNVKSLGAWWAAYASRESSQDHAVGAKVYKSPNLFAQDQVTNPVRQDSLEHLDKPVLRDSSQILKDAKINNHGSRICACGNPGHLSLDEWYSSWGKSLGVGKLGPDDDLLDIKKCVEEIKSLVPLVQLVDGCCTVCRSLLNTIPAVIHEIKPIPDKKQEQKRHHLFLPYFPHVAAFHASVVRGCNLCTMWEQEYRCPTRPSPSLSIEDFFKIENRLKCLRKDISFSVGIRNKGSSDVVSKAYGLSDSSRSPDLTLFLCRPCVARDGFQEMGVVYLAMTGTNDIDISIDSEVPSVVRIDRSMMRFELAKRWITDCVKNHPSCRTDFLHTFPSRLLEVREDSVRLVRTVGWVHQPPYATLSHCWGDHKFQTLTTDNLNSFLLNIPTEILSKTFQDAITAAQHFEISYLWIDSLCIIQNSTEDWTVESSKMASVYRGAVINISAAGARDGTEGCFLTPTDFDTKLQVATTQRGFREAWTISKPPEYISDTPLAKRAWTLQERLLAPRSIHFMRSGLAWECKTGTATSISPQLVEREFRMNWHEIVNLYTKAQLTRESDKLVAISGIARVLQDQHTGGYLAGLWRNGIETQLPWRCVNFQMPAAYHAPSWSWASVIGEVRDIGWDIRKFHELYYHALVDHPRSKVTPKGVDEFGEIVDGVLTLICHGLILGRFYTMNTISRGVNRRLQILTPDRKVLKDYYGYSYALNSSIDDRIDVFLLPIFSYKMGMTETVGDREETGFCTLVRGLILRATNNKVGEFNRVGSFWIVSLTTYPDIFLDALDRYGAETAKSVCAEIMQESTYPKERYVITIR